MKCFNRKVLAGLGVVALGLLVFAPGALGSALPALVMLACPLSMVVMMRGMSSAGRQGAEPAEPVADAETTRLRAEVDQLRAELPERTRAEP